MADVQTLGQMSDIANQGVNPGLNDALTKGVGLAQQYQKLQDDKVAHQGQIEQLETAKLNGSIGLLRSASIMSPEIFQLSKKQMEQRAVGYGLDPGYLSVANSNPRNSLMMQRLADHASGKLADPTARAELFSWFADVGGAEVLFDQVKQATTSTQAREKLAQDTKNKAADDIETARHNQAMEVIGGQRADASSKRTTAADLRSFSMQYAQQITKTTEQPLFAAKKSLDILDKIGTGDLQANNALASELEANLATLVTPGNRATVYSMAHNQFDSVERDLMSLKNRAKGEAKTVIPKDQLKQMRLDIEALHQAYGEQHEQSYMGFRAGLPDAAKEKLDKRYEQIRKSFKLPGINDAGDTQAPALGAGAGAPPKLDFATWSAQAAQHAAAKGAKLTPAQLQAGYQAYSGGGH